MFVMYHIFTSALTILNHMLEDLLLLELEQSWLSSIKDFPFAS